MRPPPCSSILPALLLASIAIPPTGASAQQAQPSEATSAPSILASWEALGLPISALSAEGSVLTVTGNGQVEAPPDRVRIFFAVETEGATAHEAGQSNATLMASVAEALRAEGSGAPGFRLETFGYMLTPQYGPVRPDRSREITGYIARNTVQVRVDDVDRAGGLIDLALGAGANRVTNLQFEVSDPEPYRHDAMREAVRQARAEAEVMAEALGMSLGLPVDVQGGADMVFPRAMMAGVDRMEMMDATPIEAGLQTISARVTIRFGLNGAP